MHAIGLEHIALIGEAFHQEWYVRRLGLPRDLGIERLELFGVVRAVVGRNAHADEKHAGAASLCSAHHAQQVLAHLGQRLTTQRVVRAKL